MDEEGGPEKRLRTLLVRFAAGVLDIGLDIWYMAEVFSRWGISVPAALAVAGWAVCRFLTVCALYADVRPEDIEDAMTETAAGMRLWLSAVSAMFVLFVRYA